MALESRVKDKKIIGVEFILLGRNEYSLRCLDQLPFSPEHITSKRYVRSEEISYSMDSYSCERSDAIIDLVNLSRYST